MVIHHVLAWCMDFYRKSFTGLCLLAPLFCWACLSIDFDGCGCEASLTLLVEIYLSSYGGQLFETHALPLVQKDSHCYLNMPYCCCFLINTGSNINFWVVVSLLSSRGIHCCCFTSFKLLFYKLQTIVLHINFLCGKEYGGHVFGSLL